MRRPNWMNIPSMGIATYIVAFCATVFLAVALLAAAAFLPQDIIQEHILASDEILYRDLGDHYLFDKSIASSLDVGTDILMLHTSLTTNSGYLGSILTNPVHEYTDLSRWEDAATVLLNLAYEIPSDSVWFYARYWMGFRVAVRLALSFFTYAQIKRYLAFLFFALFLAAVCSVAKHANSRIAFFFAMSIVLVRPHVIATCMQFACCFLLAFGAMLLIPKLHRHGKWEALFFMEVGMITMYFDFYTVPLITMGFPLLYLYILKQEAAEPYSGRCLLRNMGAWFAGYGLMWVAKLALTSLLTSVDALGQGFQSFFSRVGIRKDAEMEQFYSVKAAFDGIREALFSDETGRIVYLLGAGAVLAVVLYQLLRGRSSAADLRRAAPCLFFAVIPLIWFVITKQPVAIHYFFQYRTIALTHWAAGVFLCYLLPQKSKTLTNTK